MSKGFKKSEPTGLTAGSTIALVPGTAAGNTYVVQEPGVVGRTSWQGKRLWDCSRSTGSWQETIGQQGARSGSISLRKAGSDKDIKADFEIRWDKKFHVERASTSRSRGTKKVRGTATTLHWTMNVRRVLKVNGVRYERVTRTFTFTQSCGFRSS